MVDIIDYSDNYAEDFKQLNLEWLNKYNLAEDYDIEIINNPRTKILEQGGFIYLAKLEHKIVGTAGLAKEGDSVYELIKMTVAPELRGKGIGKMLIEKCLDKARQLGAKKIFLYSNSQLTTAISLYKKHGFVHIDPSGSHLITADVKMELNLD